MDSKFTENVKKELEEMRKLGIKKAGRVLQNFNPEQVQEYSQSMSVGECCDLLMEVA